MATAWELRFELRKPKLEFITQSHKRRPDRFHLGGELRGEIYLTFMIVLILSRTIQIFTPSSKAFVPLVTFSPATNSWMQFVRLGKIRQLSPWQAL